MAEAAKITVARVAAIAAFAASASFVVLVVLIVRAMSHAVELAVAYLWGGWALAVAPPLAILLMLAAVTKHTVPSPVQVLTGLPLLVAAFFAVQFGYILIKAGTQMLTYNGHDGASAMGVALVGIFAWLVIVGMAVAAVIACSGIARPLGPITMGAALLAVTMGAVALFSPVLAILPALGMAAWWAVVGGALWFLEPAVGEGGGGAIARLGQGAP